MQVPDTLMGLLDDGIVEEVVRPLMSGKEAQVFMIVSEGEVRVAKIYKEAQQRNFKNRADYTEGRRVRNSRDARAMAKRSRHGKAQDEAAWRSTEVDMIYRLRQADVRVPIPYHFIDGVLIMELVAGADGTPAPRLGDMRFSAQDGVQIFRTLLSEVQKMLHAGVVHGDLSEFNVLMTPEGPVIIDLPQAVHAANNRNARKLLLRDVENLHQFARRCDPDYRAAPYGEEMWALYESGELTAHVPLTGRYTAPRHAAATGEVFALIDDARRDAERLAERMQPTGAARRQQRNRPSAAAPQRSQPDVSEPRHEQHSAARDARRDRPNAARPQYSQSGASQPRQGQAGAASDVRRDRPHSARPQYGQPGANQPHHARAGSSAPQRARPGADEGQRARADGQRFSPDRRTAGGQQNSGSAAGRTSDGPAARPASNPSRSRWRRQPSAPRGGSGGSGPGNSGGRP
jgi:RIO kinase 1